MKNDTLCNENNKENNLINDEQKCPFCNINISSSIYQDHIYCHQIEQEDNMNNVNNIDNNNNIINENNNNHNNIINENNNINNSEKEDDNKSNKILGFFGCIGNKAKEILNIDEKNNSENNKKEEEPNKITSFFTNIRDTISQQFETKKDEPNKISSFFSNIQNKITEKIEEIKEKFNDDSDKVEEERRRKKNYSIQFNSIFGRNRFNNRTNSGYINDNNIDDLLLRFEEEDNIFNKKKENLFKEEDANEILRYIPNSIIQEEKNKNENNYKCLICLYEFKIGDKVCTLPCLHIFHIDCLKNWIIRNTWCPICKSDCSLDSLLSNNIVENP